MDFYQVRIGFGLALAQNAAAMNLYAQLSENQKQKVLNEARDVRTEKEVVALVERLVGGTME